MNNEQKAYRILKQIEEYIENERFLFAEYGLPLHDDHEDNLMEIIINILNDSDDKTGSTTTST